MAFAVAGLKMAGVRIKNPASVAKTHRFFNDLERLRAPDPLASRSCATSSVVMALAVAKFYDGERANGSRKGKAMQLDPQRRQYWIRSEWRVKAFHAGTPRHARASTLISPWQGRREWAGVETEIPPGRRDSGQVYMLRLLAGGAWSIFFGGGWVVATSRQAAVARERRRLRDDLATIPCRSTSPAAARIVTPPPSGSPTTRRQRPRHCGRWR